MRFNVTIGVRLLDFPKRYAKALRMGIKIRIRLFLTHPYDFNCKESLYANLLI